MNGWKIDQLPQQSSPGQDWVAWLISPAGDHVKVQVAGQVGFERSMLIVQEFAGIIRSGASFEHA